MKAVGGGQYEPPPEHACIVDEGEIDLGYDPEAGERHVLYRKVLYYRGRAVWFSLQQTIYDSERQHHIVSRVDCRHSQVHRHVFSQARGEIDVRLLVTIPPLGQTVVDEEFDRYLNEMLSNWEARVRTWRSS